MNKTTNKTTNKTSTTSQTRFESLIGIHVSDEQGYNDYRAGMTPLLEAHGGYFRYDFRVNEMLKGDAQDPFNRVFVISFPDEETMNEFFANEQYKAVRNAHFDRSVRSFGRIASYSVDLEQK